MNSNYPVKITSAGILYLNMPEELSILEDFMIIDLNLNNVQDYLIKIDEVLDSGISIECSGNTTILKIKKDKTEIYNISIDQECRLDTLLLKEILKNYLKESLLFTIEKDLKRKQVIYDKAKKSNSLKDILKIKSDLQQDKII
ncbi:hypothetical protein ACOJQI_03140 [Bacillus salacetis]|uniref:hypothetical protein n=1 Tax=Bacillus salacetis TaxID=2315464 RepID=UPI003BA1BEB7